MPAFCLPAKTLAVVQAANMHLGHSMTNGFKVVIGTSFADIFYGNCVNNQLLPVQLASEQMDQLFAVVENDASAQITVNLQQQSVKVAELSFTFEIAEQHKKQHA